MREGEATQRYAKNENKDLTYTHATPKTSLGISFKYFDLYLVHTHTDAHVYMLAVGIHELERTSDI